MKAIYLTEQDVAGLVDMPLALAAVEESFIKTAAGEAENVPRARAKAPGIVLHAMSAAAGYLGVVGWKNYTTTRSGAKFLVGLHAASSGDLVALIEADCLGRYRTGAATGVAIKALAPRDLGSLGLIGAGIQAETQLLAACHVRPIQEAIVYSRNAERRRSFATRMHRRLAEELGREVVIRVVNNAQEAVVDQPLVITATSSSEPVFDHRDLSEGSLLCAVGSNWPHRAEVPPEAVAGASVYCDSIPACRIEAGDLLRAEQTGHFDWHRATELATAINCDIVEDAEHILFKSVGLAIEDVALGFQLIQRANAKGVGRPLPMG